MKRILLIVVLLSLGLIVNAQTTESSDTPAPVIFIYDASGSMWGQMEGKTKMEIASTVLSSTVNTLPGQQQIGLVAYGHRQEGDCKDVEFLVDSSSGNAAAINSALTGIKPLGMTPLAYSATVVIDHLKQQNKKATIILITDGIESCKGNICEVVKAAKAEGIDFKLHIIGFGLKSGETTELKCAASAGDGTYFDAANAGDLSAVLNEAVVSGVDKPKGNFGVFATTNGQPIDVWVRAYTPGTKDEIGALRTYGETRYMYLPTGKFDLLVTPLSTDIKSLKLESVENVESEMTIKEVAFDGGILKVSAFNNEEGWDAVVKVMDPDGNVAASSRTYGRTIEMEVNPGTYTLSYQALVLEGLNTKHLTDEIEVTAGSTKEVTHEFSSGFANIYPKVGGALIDCVVNVYEIESDKNVANSRSYTKGASFMLNPAKYRVKVIPLGAHKGKATQLIELEVTKGGTVDKTINF